MFSKYHYATVTEALKDLGEQGFTEDFHVGENGLFHNGKQIHPDDFEIVDVYRYEGDTDPADEATVYAIESKTGLRGVLVTGYGMSSGEISEAILEKLRRREE